MKCYVNLTSGYKNEMSASLKTTVQSFPFIESKWFRNRPCFTVNGCIIQDIWSLFFNVVFVKVYTHDMWLVCMIFPWFPISYFFKLQKTPLKVEFLKNIYTHETWCCNFCIPNKISKDYIYTRHDIQFTAKSMWTPEVWTQVTWLELKEISKEITKWIETW